MSQKKKLFVGRKIRNIRNEQGLTQAKFADTLGISTSYLNQIENNQRHITASVLISLAERFSVDVSSLSDSDADRILVDLKEVFADPSVDFDTPALQEMKLVASNAPEVARALISVHQALRRNSEKIAELGHVVDDQSSGLTPYNEVRDFFHYRNNYIDELDKAGEALAASFDGDDMLASLQSYLLNNHQTSVIPTTPEDADTLRRFDPSSKTIRLNPHLDRSSQCFQLAHHIGQVEQKRSISNIIANANFGSVDAKNIATLSLANYFAGAVTLPYSHFLNAARDLRHDLDLLCERFQASIEQVAHRLSTLQRPGAKGLPFFFARVDQAGNITKRHSATKLQFARFGSACPLWNVHQAFETRGEIIRQLAETPDGAQYLCLAIAVSKRSGGFGTPTRKYALALGCDIAHAEKVVYSDGLIMSDASQYEPIGVSCRLCERENCHQRSVPPLQRKLNVNPHQRQVVPFSLG